MIYLNNAGTTWPKPPTVAASIREALDSPPDAWGEIYEEALDEVTGFFGLPNRERFLFTSGATAALATALTDLTWSEGDVIITSNLEHHALFRWLFKLADEGGVRIAVSPYAPGRPLDLDFVEATLKGGTQKKGRVKLIAVSHAANTTGEILPVRELTALARRHDALVLLDAAQTAGILPMNVGDLGVDIFTFAGHKGPLGPQGIGGLYVGPRVAMKVPMAACEIAPPTQASDQAATPGPALDIVHRECANIPSFCDVGSFNVAGGAGLAAGLRFLKREGLELLRRQGRERTRTLMEKLQALDRITVFGAPDDPNRTHTFSFRIQGMTVADAGARLKQAGIFASAGLQCSPMAHEALGTADGGTLRFSSGPFTTDEQIHAAIGAITELVDS